MVLYGFELLFKCSELIQDNGTPSSGEALGKTTRRTGVTAEPRTVTSQSLCTDHPQTAQRNIDTYLLRC